MALACPLMMFFMMRGMHDQGGHDEGTRTGITMTTADPATPGHPAGGFGDSRDCRGRRDEAAYQRRMTAVAHGHRYGRTAGGTP